MTLSTDTVFNFR